MAAASIARGELRHAPLAPRDRAFAGSDVLAVSVEPPGGSPTGTATGPVVCAVQLERLG